MAIASTIAVGVALAVLIPTVVTGVGPLEHLTCVRGSEIATRQLQMPQALVNAPYGGEGFVNSTWTNNVALFTPGTGFPGVGEANGSVAGAFVQVNVTLYSLSSRTAWGPGSNDRCTSAYQISLPMSVSGGTYLGMIFTGPWGPQFGPGALTDRLEPHMVNLSTAQGDSSPYFSNGFTENNGQVVSTCGEGSQSFYVNSTYLTVQIPFSINGQTHNETLVLPYDQSFHYKFPPDFGTWQVDDLSAPGGPGGGWAFNFVPCP